MSWLIPKLNKRVQIGKSIQTNNENGGFDLTFNTLLTVWMGLKPLVYKGVWQDYIRGEQVNENVTHEFIARRLSLSSLGKELSSSFSAAFDSITDFMPLKTEYYLFLQNPSTVKGRLFRIRGVINVGENDEYLKIGVEEIEERGTGYPEWLKQENLIN